MTNPLINFNDFMAATGSLHIRGPKSFINAASKHTYFMSRLIAGRFANKKLLRGGANIKFSIFFDGNGTGEWYLPGQPQNYPNPQRLIQATDHFRFNRVSMTWTEQEFILNQSSGGTGQFQQFVDIKAFKEALMWTEKWKLMEESLWAQPDKDTMEGDTAAHTRPKSIMVHVNEDPNGQWGSGWYAAKTWTTKAGINPTDPEVMGQYQPQRALYTNATGGAEGNIISAMDDLWQDVQFEAPTMHREYFENPSIRSQMIVTSKRGRTIYMGLLRNHQDRFIAGNQDPAYPDPQFHGLPVVRSSEFERGLYYNGGANTPATEFGATNKGPRYLFLTGQHLYPTFHKQRYFFKDEVMRHPNVPDTWMFPVRTYMQTICDNPRKQGIVAPSGSVYTA